MKNKTLLRVGGVPEHFNLPWQRAAERDIFSTAGIDLSWTMYAGGTGAMTQALQNGTLDVAILLTEGFVAAAYEGLKAKIAKVYIDSPLVWGIYTSSDSTRRQLSDGAHAPIAISRFGSGSHLMSMIHAQSRGIRLQESDFVVVNSLHGAVESLQSHASEIFYWERYMTRPHVKSGQLKMIGDFSAPWSSFLIIVSDEALKKKDASIQTLLQIMNLECIAFKQDNHSAIQLSKKFDMSLPEARNWLKQTQWNYDFRVDEASLMHARTALTTIGKCDEKLKINRLIAPWLNLL